VAAELRVPNYLPSMKRQSRFDKAGGIPIPSPRHILPAIKSSSLLTRLFDLEGTRKREMIYEVMIACARPDTPPEREPKPAAHAEYRGTNNV
jgi:hypothetical protein